MPKTTDKKRTSKKTVTPFKNKPLIFLSLALFISMIVVLSQSQQIQNLRGRAQITNCNVPTEELTLDSEEKALFDKINTYRQEQGKAQLKLSPSLIRSSAWLSADMNTSKKLSHTDSLGRTMQARLVQCAYPGANAGGSENIASTGTSAESAFSAWKKSTQGHNENMLNDRWKVMAVSRSGNYWVFNAGSIDDSAAPTTPPVEIPSPACLGACATPSVAPSPTGSQIPVTGQPTTIVPTAPETTQTPDEETIDTPPVVPDEGERRSGGGIIGLFLEFIIRLLELLGSLFGRR